ncbi:MAG TPA: trypsin-like peptidase domain-containing protein [Gemmataceae bacterium]|nr:trypsin-like peptidase domain-containing protein [Gemmataceae bacterium]
MAQRRGIRAAVGLLLFSMVSCLAGPPIRAQSENTEKIYQRLLRSTVWVVVPTSRDLTTNRVVLTTGSGSLIDRARRLVLTNYHVVRHVVGKENEKVIVAFPVFQNGKAVAERSFYVSYISRGGIRGQVIAWDEKRDLALIKLERVPDEAQQVALARESPSPGQDVHSVGNPGQSGALWVYTPGKVRQVYHQKWHSGSGADRLDLEAKIVETQSPINRGDSGGPLVNNKGELVAVTQGHLLDAQQLSLFIDVSEVRTFLTHKRLLPSPMSENARSLASSSESKPPDEEKRAATRLEFAKELAQAGKLETAKAYCQQILDSYPKTKAADGARLLLDKLK